MMEVNRLDFTIFFRRLCDIKFGDDSADHEISDLCIDRNAFNDWMKQYRLRMALENRPDDERQSQMKRSNPKFILRNYLAQNAIDAAQRHDFSEIEKLRHILSQPFAEQPEHESYAALPPDWASELSVSCSS